MEKLKNILFDISDILISLVIITVIFFVISWKLNEAMPINYDTNKPDTTTDNSLPLDNTEVATEDNVVNLPEDTDNLFIEDERPTENNSPAVDIEVIETTPVVETPVSQSINFEIPSGSTGFAIAKLLKEQGLITDINGFIARVEEMGLGAKLRSGTFKLTTDMNMDQIINVLANVK